MQIGFGKCNVCKGSVNRVCATCWDQICEGCDHDHGHSVLLMYICDHNVPSVKRDDLIRHFDRSLIESHWSGGRLLVHLDPVPWIQDLSEARKLGRPRCNSCPNSLKVRKNKLPDEDAKRPQIKFCSLQCKGDGIAKFLNERPDDQEWCTHLRESKKGQEFKFCIDCRAYLCMECRSGDHRVNHRVLRTWRGGNSVFVKDVQSLVDCIDIQKKQSFWEECVQLFRTVRHECRACSKEISFGNEFCSVRCKREENV